MKNHEYFMKIAISEAMKGIESGQTPFGSCIVKNGEIIAVNHNIVWKTTDITAHAEIITIRNACQNLKSIDLSGSIIYSTCEPCPMCFSAIHWARIDEIIYGASIEDAKIAGFNELIISNDKLNYYINNEIRITKSILKSESRQLFKIWKEKVNKPY